MNKKALLQCVFSLTLFSTMSIADDFYSDAKFQNTTPFLDRMLLTSNELMECHSINNSTETVWNTGEICFASDIDASKENISAKTQLKSSYSKKRKNILEGVDGAGAECVSDGGSSAASESLEGFCLATDLNTTIANAASFSVANELPVAGMQFLQVVFSDGSTLGSSAPIGAECISSGESISAPENAEGFCLASDLSRSTSAFANFAVANGLPVAGLQFVQVLFADNVASTSSGVSTECTLIGGSTATTGSNGGFCLTSDLSTSVAGFANFSIAHDVPVTDLQFLQITFEGAGSSEGVFSSPGAGAPIGAECISVEGSIAAIDNPNGFCLVSDLVESSIDNAGLAIANNLPVSGMQFLQMKFSDAGGVPSSVDSIADCVSDEGSTAVSGNPGGFCLVSDLINSTVESANISVANDLPVMSWEFLQVPSKNVSPIVGSNNPLSSGVPKGVVVSSFEEIPFALDATDNFDTASPFILENIINSQRSLFHFSDQTNGVEVYSTPYWRTYPNIGLWVGR